MIEREASPWVTGRIIMVQEDRFRMTGDNGKGYLFNLSYLSAATQADLARWKDRNARVMVRYEGAPNLDSGIAHSVRPLSGGGAKRKDLS